MSSEDLSTRLREAVRRRDVVAANVNRIEARRDAAKQNLSEAENECRAKGIDPAQIDAYLAQIETRLKDLVEGL